MYKLFNFKIKLLTFVIILVIEILKLNPIYYFKFNNNRK